MKSYLLGFILMVGDGWTSKSTDMEKAYWIFRRKAREKFTDEEKAAGEYGAKAGLRIPF